MYQLRSYDGPRSVSGAHVCRACLRCMEFRSQGLLTSDARVGCRRMSRRQVTLLVCSTCVSDQPALCLHLLQIPCPRLSGFCDYVQAAAQRCCILDLRSPLTSVCVCVCVLRSRLAEGWPQWEGIAFLNQLTKASLTVT